MKALVYGGALLILISGMSPHRPADVIVGLIGVLFIAIGLGSK